MTDLPSTPSGEVAWTAADAALFPKHQYDRFDRPRTCQRCGYVQHDGSGIGWHPCSVKFVVPLARLQPQDTAASVMREALEASDYLSSLYERLWKGGVVRDLAEAIARRDSARTALTATSGTKEEG